MIDIGTSALDLNELFYIFKVISPIPCVFDIFATYTCTCNVPTCYVLTRFTRGFKYRLRLNIWKIIDIFNVDDEN